MRDGTDSSGTCENTVVRVTATRQLTDAGTLRIHRHRGEKQLSKGQDGHHCRTAHPELWDLIMEHNH